VNLDLDDDQRMLKASVERLLAGAYGFEQRRKHLAAPDGWSRAVWAQFAELGLLMLPFRADDGGLGLGAVETMIVGEAFGRALVVEPFLPSVVLAGAAIARGGSPDQRARLLPGLMNGSRNFALAEHADIAAREVEGGWSLSGTAIGVPGGDSADMLVLPTERGWFVVASKAIERRAYRLHGGGGAADLRLAEVIVAADDRLAIAFDGAMVREARIAHLAAEAVGAMAAAFDLTVEHLKTRHQFGRPLGANQALRHRAAEMLVELEQARSAALLAAMLADEQDRVARAEGYEAVAFVIHQACRFISQQAVQLHGGIGVSDEHPISHYFRRLTAVGMMISQKAGGPGDAG